MADRLELLSIFQEARRFLARPENDFDWSSWRDTEHALSELDGVLEKLRKGLVPRNSMSIFFTPTGPMQEVALSSDWSNEFDELANRYDAAIVARDEGCICFQEPSRELETIRELPPDRYFAEIKALSCPRCGQYWLRYLYEVEAISHSGRWYLGAISGNRDLENPIETFRLLEWYFAGGSYYGGRVSKMSGPIIL